MSAVTCAVARVRVLVVRCGIGVAAVAGWAASQDHWLRAAFAPFGVVAVALAAALAAGVALLAAASAHLLHCPRSGRVAAAFAVYAAVVVPLAEVGHTRGDLLAVAAALETVGVALAGGLLLWAPRMPGLPASAAGLLPLAAGVLGVTAVVAFAAPDTAVWLLGGPAAGSAAAAVLVVGGAVRAVGDTYQMWWIGWGAVLVAAAHVHMSLADLGLVDAGGQVPVGLAGLAVAFAGAVDIVRSGLARRREQLALLEHELTAQREVHRRIVAESAERDHEIRSGLSGLARATELLGTAADPTSAALRRAVLQELDRLQALVTGGVTAPGTFAVAPLLHDLAALRRSSGLVTEVDADPALRAYGDRAVVAQVLVNLLVNAAHHAAGAPVRLTAAACGDRVVVEVADSGPGIPVGIEDRVLERGVRGAGSVGSGLGLHISSRLLTAAGGSLRVQRGNGPAGASGTVATVEIAAALERAA